MKALFFYPLSSKTRIIHIVNHSSTSSRLTSRPMIGRLERDEISWHVGINIPFALKLDGVIMNYQVQFFSSIVTMSLRSYQRKLNYIWVFSLPPDGKKAFPFDTESFRNLQANILDKNSEPVTRPSEISMNCANCNSIRVLWKSRGFKEAHNSFFGIGWIFSNQFLAWKACFDFHHTTPPFQPMIKWYVLVGFQATAVAIATVMQSTSFWITSIISKSSQTLGNETFRI